MIGYQSCRRKKLALANTPVEVPLEFGAYATENALVGDAAERIYGLRDDYERRLRALVVEGQQDGSIIAVEPKIAVFMLLGTMHWVAKWYRETGEWSADQVSDAIIELVTRSLATRPPRRLKSKLHVKSKPEKAGKSR